MANSFELDVRYTHSSIMGVYAANLILLQLFIKSQPKNNGKELLHKIPTYCKAPLEKKNKNSILSVFPSSMKELREQGKLPPWCRAECPGPCECRPPVHHSALPYKDQAFRKLSNLVCLLVIAMFSLHHTFIPP